MWTAETINGWNGRSNADAVISNLGFSLLSALDKHCKKYMVPMTCESRQSNNGTYPQCKDMMTYKCGGSNHSVVGPAQKLSDFSFGRMIQA